MEEKILKNVCRICSAGCGVNVYVKNGKVVKIEGMKEFPTNEGTICAKGALAKEVIYSKDRLLYPIKRVGERGEKKWKKISWDEALNEISKRLTEIKNRYGPQAIAMYEGQQWHWNAGAVVINRFLHSLGSPNYTNPGNMCWCPVTMAMLITYGPPYVYLKLLPGTFKFDEQPTKCMVFWGANPLISRINRARGILDAKGRGSKIIAIDPYFSTIAAKADIWAQIKPGTDLLLALSLINVLINENLYDKNFVKRWTHGFDELVEHVKDYSPEMVEDKIWIPADKIRKIARLYANNRPAIIEDHIGITQQLNGFDTHRAICIIRAISGNFDVKGGEVFLNIPQFFSRFYDYSLLSNISKEIRPIGADKFPLFSKLAEWAPSCWGIANLSQFPGAILNERPYPIKGLIVMGGNPVTQSPNSLEWEKALKKLDFLVSVDLFVNATGKFADIILPAAWWLEKTDLSEQWPILNYILLRQGVEPPGECWPEEKIIFELSKRMGLEGYFPWNSMEEVIDDLFSPLNVKNLKKNPSGIWIDKEIRYKKYEEHGFNTPSGKIEIYSNQLKEMGYNPLPLYRDYLEYESKDTGIGIKDLEREYPLILTKHNSPVYLHSQLRNIPLAKEIEPEPFLEIHPLTAKEVDIQNGDRVIIESPRGMIKAKADITNLTHPKVVFLVHGWEEANFNTLVSGNILDPVSGSPAARECRVRIRRE